MKPGYLYELVPPEAPVKGEDWRAVMADVENIIMPGITHWNSPQFHAYFPTSNSYPSLIGDMLCSGIGCIGFSWVWLLNLFLPCQDSPFFVGLLQFIRIGISKILELRKKDKFKILTTKIKKSFFTKCEKRTVFVCFFHYYLYSC